MLYSLYLFLNDILSMTTPPILWKILSILSTLYFIIKKVLKDKIYKMCKYTLFELGGNISVFTFGNVGHQQVEQIRTQIFNHKTNSTTKIN